MLETEQLTVRSWKNHSVVDCTQFADQILNWLRNEHTSLAINQDFGAAESGRYHVLWRGQEIGYRVRSEKNPNVLELWISMPIYAEWRQDEIDLVLKTAEILTECPHCGGMLLISKPTEDSDG